MPQGGTLHSPKCTPPVGIAAEEYGACFFSDRNDLLKFQRLGDANRRRAYQTGMLGEDWFGGQELIRLATSSVTVAFVTCLRIEHWINAAESRVQLPDVVPTREELIQEIRSTDESTRALAVEAAYRQAHKTEEDIDRWIEKIVNDVKDARD
jgi:hypothetical protein